MRIYPHFMTRKLLTIVVSVCALLISGGLLLEWDVTRSSGSAVNDTDSPLDTQSGVLQTSQPVELKAPGPASPSREIETAKIAVLRERMRQDGDGLQVERRPDGSESLDLKGRFTHFSAAVRTDSGEMKIQCFSGYAPLVDAVSGRRQTRESNKGSNEPVNF